MNHSIIINGFQYTNFIMDMCESLKIMTNNNNSPERFEFFFKIYLLIVFSNLIILQKLLNSISIPIHIKTIRFQRIHIDLTLKFVVLIIIKHLLLNKM